MSVSGIDVGNSASCVALARNRGIDVIMNKESKRETPAVVSFDSKMRHIGTDGAAKQSVNLKNSVTQIKRFVGKNFSDPQVQQDMKRVPYKVEAGPDGGCMVVVNFQGQERSFTPEAILAMLLVDTKQIAFRDNQHEVTDCVLSCPCYFTEKERHAILAAAEVAGLKCYRVMNENTATALAYGIYKTDLPEDEPLYVAFIDLGHSSLQVAVVAYKKGSLEVKSHAWDANLGGRDFDQVLYEHFADEFQAKYKRDVRTNPKGTFRLLANVEKTKKTLSANSEVPINVEMLMDEIDFASKITRDKFEELSAPLLERVKPVLVQALDRAGVAVNQISSVQAVGSSTRIPSVLRILEEFFGQQAGRGLNSKEVVSRGCALQCAMLSPIFRVRDFDVKDWFPFSVSVAYDKEGVETKKELFTQGNAVPFNKALQLNVSHPFNVRTYYTETCHDQLHASAPKELGHYKVGPFTIPAGREKAQVKVMVKLTLHGTVVVHGAQQVVEEQYTEKVPVVPAPKDGEKGAKEGAKEQQAGEEDTPMTDATNENAPPTGTVPNGQAPADGSVPAGEAMDVDGEAKGAAPAEPEYRIETKTRAVRQEVPVSGKGLEVSKDHLNALLESEGNMAAQDRLVVETLELKNEVEAYILALRGKLYTQYEPYVREEDRSKLSSLLEKAEDWLYEEGEDQTKSVYSEKLKELKSLGQPIETRAREDANRPQLVGLLLETCKGYQEIAQGNLPAYAHLTPEEKSTVASKSAEALKWLEGMQSQQKALSLYDDPVLKCEELQTQLKAVEEVCKPIITKPVPKVEEKKQDEPMDGAADNAKEAAKDEAGEQKAT